MDRTLNSGLVQWAVARTAEQWTAAGTWATVAVASVAAIIGLRQVKESRRLRIDQAQAYVVAYMDQSPASPKLIEIVFRNFGTTAARNIEITVSPKLRRTDGSGGVEDVWVPDVIPFLAPGQEWRTFWDNSPDYLTNAELRGAHRHVVGISFDGVHGTDRQRTSAVLDWDAHRGRLFIGTKTLSDAAAALEKIASSTGQWTEGRDGLAVFTRSGQAKDEEREHRIADLIADLHGPEHAPGAADDPGGIE
jgi:hypothetical protein